MQTVKKNVKQFVVRNVAGCEQTGNRLENKVTCDVTLRRTHETIAAVQKQLALRISVCVRACVFSCALEWVIALRACVCVSVGARARACACARVALLIQSATRRHVAICGLSGSTTFFDIISVTQDFRKKKVIGYKMCTFIFSTIFI